MYVLIGNQGQAAIFRRRRKTDSFELFKKFENEPFTKKESKIYSHRAGTGTTSYTSDQVTFGEGHYKDELVSRFCKDIVESLEKATKDEKAQKVIVVGAPALVGELRKKSSKKLNSLIADQIPKNFYTEKSHELETFLKHRNYI
jgi:protein required for attachment to host cells